MNADKRRCTDPVGQRHPWRQIHIHFSSAGQGHLDTFGFEKTGDLKRDIENDLSFTDSIDADCTGIRPTMPWVHHNPVAPSRNLRQTRSIDRSLRGPDANATPAAAARTIEISFSNRPQPLGGKSLEAEFPSIGSRAHQAQVSRVERHALLKLDHQPGGTRRRLPEADFTHRTRTTQSPGSAEFTRKINPDPWALTAITVLEKRIETRSGRRAQLQHSISVDGPCRQSTGRPGGQSHQPSSGLQSSSNKQCGEATGQPGHDQVQNTVVRRCCRQGI